MFRLRRLADGESLRRTGLEFVVIVMGVLVAHAGDQWRQHQEETRELNGYLANVLSEVQQNLRTVRRIRNILAVLKVPALETVVSPDSR